MGKRKGGLSGLSRFVLAFKQDSISAANVPDYTAIATKQEEDEPPVKRRKTKPVEPDVEASQEGWTGQWITKYDATGLVPHYTDASQVPEHLQKYFAQRYRFLSLYSTPPGCLLDEEGWYSITPELVADQIAERCRCDTILDAFCGVGGNAIAFAKTCQRVIALDTSPTRLALARHNAQIYGVADRIEFILSDYISFANSYLTLPRPKNVRKIDVVFLSPPWGGPLYLSGTPTESALPSPTKNSSSPPGGEIQRTPTPVEAHPSFSLSSIQPIHGAKLFRLSRRITPNIAYYLPRNTRLEEISDLLDSEFVDASGTPSETLTSADTERNPTLGSSSTGKGKDSDLESVEVEEEWMGTKLKALTCYFGGLAAGHEDLF